MSRKFTITQKPYDDTKIFNKRVVTIKDGITVLVGCNGIGKTTLIRKIKSNLDKNDIPYISYDNLKDGGSNSISKASFSGDFGFIARAMTSSEGETIILNMSMLASTLRSFIVTGDVQGLSSAKFAKAMKKLVSNNITEEEEEQPLSKERWILLDAVDSGLSVDSVVELKEELFDVILKDELAKDFDIYIVVTANEYEMARGMNCLDVANMKYIKLKDYEDYRRVILNSRHIKDARYEKG